ncbi:MAG: hypothetical protein KJZ86_00375 [Caldilineaceae bacterium]|nr:hypothetical protein [Caldilineaceae bacterium]HRJ45067.1 hypothetical protein [Caldilineaceae bacterium]
MIPSPPLPSLIFPLRRFLVVEQCPAEWQHFDLYLFRDEEVVFYVGQSYTAFNRAWSHIYDGWKGRSLVGRFVLMNWPRALHFVVELHHSQADRFAVVENNLNRAEQMLIQRHQPCFNDIYNPNPTPLPAHYNPPTSLVRHPRNLPTMIRQAEQANQQESRRNPDEWG